EKKIRPPSLQMRTSPKLLALCCGARTGPLSRSGCAVAGFAAATVNAPRPSSKAIRLGSRSHLREDNGRNIATFPLGRHRKRARPTSKQAPVTLTTVRAHIITANRATIEQIRSQRRTHRRFPRHGYTLYSLLTNLSEWFRSNGLDPPSCRDPRRRRGRVLTPNAGR